MSYKFIPEADAEFLLMAQSFASGIASSPYTYSLSPSDAETITRAVNEYQSALLTANSELTRTSGAVSAKDVARNAARGLIRRYAAGIRANYGITNQAKIDIGIKPRNTKLTRRPCPQTSPQLSFEAATPGEHTLRCADSLNITARGKPFGAHALQLFMSLCDYGIKPNRDPEQARYVGEYGRNRIVVQHQFKDAGKTAVYFARWVGARNEHGPWSLPLTVQVMFAGSPESPVESSQPSQQAPKAEHDDGGLKLAA